MAWNTYEVTVMSRTGHGYVTEIDATTAKIAIKRARHENWSGMLLDSKTWGAITYKAKRKQE